ncbi:MAG: ribosomal-protein-alanine N-acetyltransferase [Lachnospiraceae bacterium]|nr:ribosomal-protein-alanine N-acetyltransferase [Lachnospiraceae bacterium]
MDVTASYVIREMAFDDISPIADMEKVNFSAPEVWSGTDFLTHLLREDALYLVAEAEPSTGVEKQPAPDDSDGEWQDPDILGYAGVLMVPDESDITKISVRPDQRRKGIGKALLKALQAKMPEHGVRKIFLEVRVSNAAAIRLYESCGFEQVGERKKYYSDPVEDALVMLWEDKENSAR